MFFALGALAATLVALMVLPAVWNRAVRLTTRRIEAAVPVSLFEIQAAKDQQRAQLALAQRRVEIERDDLLNQVTAQAGEMEARRLRIVDLEREAVAARAAHDALAAQLAAEEEALRERTQQLDLTRTTLAAREADLATRTSELQETRATLERTRADLSGQTARGDKLDAVLATRDATIAEQKANLTRLKEEVSRLSRELGDALGHAEKLAADLARERKALADLKAATDAERARRDAQETELLQARETLRTTADQRAGRLTQLDHDLKETAARLAAAKADLAATQSTARLTETRRAEEFARAEADARRLKDELAMVRADHAMMEGALAKARAERDALAQKDSDLAVLRDRLSDVAARILVKATGEPLEIGSAPDGQGETRSLADRIQAARAEAAGP
ncbi:MAG: hypothetical protein AB1592_11205, partial [Pseudomonadota bacterium]